ncbi:alpha/beta hydrolase [Hymenobacter sp. BRD128]|uniref:alpha/beta hydrolase-fold protein n=1 Tax=Hymenobacter sp. BRD128 TaxID=2675878 RepID=UPI001566A0FC|nr:alpha/beta hydrolase-fold protein [Hymenobacter sp. BRD128]QKG58677.1 alpha/beta hydrolase [Hymenobacter sp. BRD128]
MKQLLLLWLCILTTLTRAQTVKNNTIVIGRVDSVTSSVLNEKRKLWVYVPAGANDPTYAQQRYPVLYVLDGDAHFASVMGMVQQLSQVNGNTVLPEMIVVGIPNTNRTRDLTPTHVTSAPGLPAEALKSSGGGENFTAFLEKELIPYVDAHYPTVPHRTLVGHSFGGLLVMNTLLHHPALFDNYVALDPSMWWDGQKLLREAPGLLAQPGLAGRALFVGIANTMPTGFDTVQVRRDTSSATDFMRSKLSLRDELARHSGNGLRVRSKYYPNDTHGSVPLPATYDALRFLFQAYAPSPAALYDLSEPGSKIQPAAFVEAHYQRVSAAMGYPVLPPEPMVNSLAYYLLQSNQAAHALAMFQLNARNYPTSFNVHDSLGDYYSAQKQPALAIAAYTKALQLKDTPDTRQKLSKLRAKK